MSDETSEDGLPQLPHLSGEFYVWLWWASESQGSSFKLPDPVGPVDLWIDERLAFRNVGDTKVTAIMTGEASSTSLEARAALAGGKVLEQIRVGIRRDDREFQVTLKGPGMHTTGLKLPQVVSDGQEEILYDRMFLYSEVNLILGALYQQFTSKRLDSTWQSEVVPAIQGWIWGDAEQPGSLAATLG